LQVIIKLVTAGTDIHLFVAIVFNEDFANSCPVQLFIKESIMKTQFSLPRSLGNLVLTATILVSVACSNQEKKDNDMSYYKANPSDASSQAISTDQPPPQSEIASSQKKPNISRTTPTQVLIKNSETKKTSPLAEQPAKLPIQATQQAAMQRIEKKVEDIDEKTATNSKAGGQKETAEKVTNLTVTNQNKSHHSQIGENSNVADNNSLTKPSSGKVENMTEIQPPNPRVLFYVTDQRKLNEEQLETIKHHAGFLAVHPHYMIQIHGHTDSQGPVDYNNKLARERAQIIADQLVSAGVDPKQIEVFGWGSADPLLSVSQYDKNRRVELVYLSNHITLSENHDSSPEQNAEVIESP